MSSARRTHTLAAATSAHRSSSASCIVAAIGHGATAAAIVSSTTVTETMPAPAVAISPASPWAHAKEDAVVEIPRPVKTVGRASVWRIVVVAVGTDRLNTNADDDLRLRRWRQGQPRQQCCGTENRFKSAHDVTPLKVSAVACIAWDAAVTARKTPATAATIRILNPFWISLTMSGADVYLSLRFSQ
jgi:hypothetical protein